MGKEHPLTDADWEEVERDEVYMRDLKMWSKAIKEKWPIDNAMRERIVGRLSHLMETSQRESVLTQVVKTLLQADAINVAREKIDAMSDEQTIKHIHMMGEQADELRGEIMQDQRLIARLEEEDD